jgi:hypothetical protein
MATTTRAAVCRICGAAWWRVLIAAVALGAALVGFTEVLVR